mgnify:CR=1 FL=1
MSQMRDTIIPVCQVVEVEAALISAVAGEVDGVSGVLKEVPLRATAREIEGATFPVDKLTGLTSDFSNWPTGVSSCTVSSTGLAFRDATVNITTYVNNGTSSTVGSIQLTDRGLYGGDAANFGIKNMFTPNTDHGSDSGLAPSGTVTVHASIASVDVPYVSVTAVSGAGRGGFFRVLPGSSTSLYANQASGSVSSIQTSGYGGVVDAQVSGWPGVVAPHNGTATLTLPAGVPMGSIIIDNKIMNGVLGVKTIFAVNYGTVKHASPQADNDLRDLR